MFDFEVIYSNDSNLISRLGDFTVIISIFDDCGFIVVGDKVSKSIVQESQYNF